MGKFQEHYKRGRKTRIPIAAKSLEQVTIVGVGFLGGSIGLAIQAAGLACLRVGLGPSGSQLRFAGEMEAVDIATTSYAKALEGADLIIIAAPITKTEKVLRRLAAHVEAGCVVTDISSTKSGIVETARHVLPDDVYFVGANPIVGAEQKGVEYARGDLFDHSICILTPTRSTPRQVVNLVADFWQELGPQVYTMSPEDHDEVMARISHLPHAIASVLLLVSQASGGLDLAGPALLDSTRVASNDPSTWADILLRNRNPTVAALDEIGTHLKRLRSALIHGDRQTLSGILHDAKARRDRWIARKYEQDQMPG